MLRVAREVFAVLPIGRLLLNTFATVFDSSTGHSAQRPIYSVRISREEFERLNFQELDPSDAIESFPHRGDFKASRKGGAFQAIEPWTPDGEATSAGLPSLSALRHQAAVARQVLVKEREALSPSS